MKQDSLVLTLDTDSSVTYNFGLGTWEMFGNLDSLVSTIDKIKVTTKKSTESYIGEYQIKSFFSDRFTNHKFLLGDSLKARIEVTIK